MMNLLEITAGPQTTAAPTSWTHGVSSHTSDGFNSWSSVQPECSDPSSVHHEHETRGTDADETSFSVCYMSLTHSYRRSQDDVITSATAVHTLTAGQRWTDIKHHTEREREREVLVSKSRTQLALAKVVPSSLSDAVCYIFVWWMTSSLFSLMDGY